MSKYIPVDPEKWAEMVKAQAEVSRLEALTAEMDKTINASQAECRHLKAEVERLTKAGDSIISILCQYVPRTGAKYALMEWRAAKEGKQS